LTTLLSPLPCDCCSSDKNPKLTRQRMHSPSGPRCVIAWPQPAQTRTAPSCGSVMIMTSGFDKDSAARYLCPSDRRPYLLPRHARRDETVDAAAKATRAGCPPWCPGALLLVVARAARTS